MSAARSHSRAAETAGAVAVAGGPVPGHRRSLLAAVFLAAAWAAALFLLDLVTARPRIVSPDQILKSDLVVIARRAAAAGDRVKIDRVYRGRKEPGNEVRVVNLADVRGLVDDQPYILPLTAFRGDFVVTILDRQQVPPLVYPALPEVIQQVKSILRDAPQLDDEADPQ